MSMNKPADKPRCETCRFWDAERQENRVVDNYDDSVMLAYCRIGRPVEGRVMMPAFQWCGEWEEIVEV